MLAILVLLASTPASTPAQYQHAAGALYRVLTSYSAEGLFQGAANEEGVAQIAEGVEDTVSLGSAFAVSGDGWLMSARHVVDPVEKLNDTCVRLRQEWPGSVMLHRVTLTLMFEDIAGDTYGLTALLIPETAGENLCDEGTKFDIGYDKTMPARIMALDCVADLALVHIDANPITYLPFFRNRPKRWSDLFAVGYSDTSQRTVQRGAVAVICEDAVGQCVQRADGTQTCPMVRVMRTTAAVQDGMSGSPQVINDRVVGITTMRALSVPIGFAVPSSYAGAWYRHVRWPARYPRPKEVCTPTPEQ